MNEPTDTAIDTLILEHGVMGQAWPTQRQLHAFARAVHAKWGTLRAEKIVIPTDTMEQEFQKHYRRGYEAGKKVTTPQPTQAQAGAVPMYRLLQSGVDRIEAADEFLSDDTTTWAIDPNGIFVGNIYGGRVLRPARRRIKGGQHVR